jgi:NADPH2 dehydrogenase
MSAPAVYYLLPDVPSVYPGYKVPYSEAIRHAADIPTAAVGLITGKNIR